MKRFLSVLAPVALYGLSNEAHAALSCKDIVELHSYGTKSDVIIQMMRDKGFESEEIACLKKKNAPQDIIAAAQELAKKGETSLDSVPDAGSELDTIDEDDSDSSGFEEESRPEKIMEARNNLKSNKPLTASYILFDILEKDEYPEYKTEVQFYLARSLERLKMYQSAYDYYTDVIRAGPKKQFFNLALPRLVYLSHITGDNAILKKVAEVLPPQNFPRKAKNQLYYLLGVKNFEDKKIREARINFNKVTSRSLLSLKSEFYQGVIAIQSNAGQASRKFRAVYDERVEPEDDREAEQINKIKDLSLLNNASLYYGASKYGDASKLYQLVDRESIYWPESLFRDAWANYMLDRIDITLGKILTVESPYFKDNQFIPETEKLKALTYLKLCDFTRVEEIAASFNTTYDPIAEELKTILEEYQSKEARAAADQVWEYYISGEEARETKLPKALFNKILTSQRLADVAYNINMMEKEIEKINLQKPQWRDSVGVTLQKKLEKNIAKNKKIAGILLLKGFKKQYNMILRLKQDFRLVGLEMKSLKGRKLEELSSNINTLDFNQKFNVDFATSADFIYWPFNKEFWADELGYYSIIADNACGQ